MAETSFLLIELRKLVSELFSFLSLDLQMLDLFLKRENFFFEIYETCEYDHSHEREYSDLFSILLTAL